MQDHNGNRDTYFMNSDGELTDQQFAFTIMQSSARLEAGHADECFGFWFSMSVSLDGPIRILPWMGLLLPDNEPVRFTLTKAGRHCQVD